MDGGDGAARRGDESTQANTQHGRLARRDAAGSDEINAGGAGVGEAVGSHAVGVSGWLRKAGKEVGVAVGHALTLIQSVRVGGDELQPAIDKSVVFADLQMLSSASWSA